MSQKLEREGERRAVSLSGAEKKKKVTNEGRFVKREEASEGEREKNSGFFFSVTTRDFLFSL